MSATEERRRGNEQPGGRGGGHQHQHPTPRGALTQNRRGGRGGVQPTLNNRPSDAPNLLAQDEHVPLKGYNGQEVVAMLNKGFDSKAPTYKPDGQAQQTGSTPWGTRPGAMSNGKDFFLELRKQVAALQQTGGVSQGG